MKIELNQSKIREQTKNKVMTKCSECDTSVQSLEQLKLHTRIYHCHNKSSQCEKVSNFEEHPCFYCDTVIISEDDLQAHVKVCSEMSVVFEEPSTTFQEAEAFPCYECGAQCTNIEDLRRHKEMYHSLETFSEDPGGGIFQCDICPLYFESNRDLQFHKRECHWAGGHFPRGSADLIRRKSMVPHRKY